MVIFVDTYAIIEIDKGNPNYKKYILKPLIAITTIFNLMEVHFKYLKDFGDVEAEQIFNHVRPIVIPINHSIIKEANKFKLSHQKKRLSFADCIGYITAKKNNAPFLTGDYMFKDFEGVEFVK